MLSLVTRTVMPLAVASPAHSLESSNDSEVAPGTFQHPAMRRRRSRDELDRWWLQYLDGRQHRRSIVARVVEAATDDRDHALGIGAQEQLRGSLASREIVDVAMPAEKRCVVVAVERLGVAAKPQRWLTVCVGGVVAVRRTT